MADEKRGSIMPWIIGGLIGAAIIYFVMKNRQPETQTMSQSQPIVRIDTSILERKLEDLSMKLEQLQVQNLSPNTYLTATSQIPITKMNEQLIKVIEDKMDKIDYKRGMTGNDTDNEKYDVSGTITNATANDPNDFDSNVYDSHRIFARLRRKAPIIYVSNDDAAQGVNVLYVTVSHDGGSSGSREQPIYAHEIKEYHDVYELKLRSPSQNLPYRITEYKIYKQ